VVDGVDDEDDAAFHDALSENGLGSGHEDLELPTKEEDDKDDDGKEDMDPELRKALRKARKKEKEKARKASKRASTEQAQAPCTPPEISSAPYTDENEILESGTGEAAIGKKKKKKKKAELGKQEHGIQDEAEVAEAAPVITQSTEYDSTATKDLVEDPVAPVSPPSNDLPALAPGTPCKAQNSTKILVDIENDFAEEAEAKTTLNTASVVPDPSNLNGPYVKFAFAKSDYKGEDKVLQAPGNTWSLPECGGLLCIE
jgi:hypothetical protein